MSSQSPTDRDRYVDLLVDDLTSGVASDERSELERLEALFDGADRLDIERSVAAATLGLLGSEVSTEEVPSHELLSKLRLAADGFEASPTTAVGAPKLKLAGTPAERDADRRESAQLSTVPAWALGGWVAAAACLVIALVVTNAQQPAVSANPADRVAVLEGEAGIVRAGWAGLDGVGLAEIPHALDRGVRGEVLWAEDRDEGVMKISGIAANDPGEYQYQLWIFDSTRREGDYEGAEGLLSQYPIDGGVFDIASEDGEIVVPIEAKIGVGKAALFAVTREKPGGVVVSDRDIVFVASVAG